MTASQGTLVLTSSFIYDQIALWRSRHSDKSPTRIYVDKFTLARSKYNLRIFHEQPRPDAPFKYTLCGLDIYVVATPDEHFHISE